MVMKVNILKNILYVYINDQYQVYDKYEYMCNIMSQCGEYQDQSNNMQKLVLYLLKYCNMIDICFLNNNKFIFYQIL